MSRKHRDPDCSSRSLKDSPPAPAGSFRIWYRLILVALCISFAYFLLAGLSRTSCDGSRSCMGRNCLSQKPFQVSPQNVQEIIDPITSGTSLGRIVFGIAATARLWEKRKEYVKLWWRPSEMRGFVWLDEPVSNWSSALPPFRISSNTSAFRYTFRGGKKSAIRISRIVSETVRVGLPEVDWFVMGDDDTVFVPENLVRVLSKYDHRKMYYIGASSESHQQNLMFSYSMAYGGGGFAISSALGTALEAHHDECIQRYPFLYGSDDRMQACMSELGVPLTREPGFHQLDVYGDVSGLLSAHPIAPLITLHHLDVINPLFPGMSQAASFRHLSKAIDIDPSGIFQQSICYDRKRSWSISVSYGYMVKAFRGVRAPRDLETPTRTFMSWNRKYDESGYSFTSRPAPKSPCDMPVVFHMKEVAYASRDGVSVSNYTRTSRVKKQSDCKWNQTSPEELRWVYVIKERTDESWFQAPRRQCCQIIGTPSSHSLRLLVRDCKGGELIG